MRKSGLQTVLPLAWVALAVGLIFFGAYSPGSNGDMNAAEAQASQPNIVFILVDDMRKGDLGYMPKTKTLLQDKGMTFENAFVSNPICCPSRATIMRGQYAHNTHVWRNTDSSTGGWEAYHTRGYEDRNVATTLKAAGYRTALIGKYLNHYQETTKPPGWDEWFVTLDPTTYNYFNYDINNNGDVRHFGSGASDYKTDVLGRKTRSFIGASSTQPGPFFAYVAPVAPHLPATPAPRHEHAYDGIDGPHLRSFNERRVSDKPSWIRQLPRLTASQIATIDARHERRVESLQAVDDLVKDVIDALNDAGVMDNTYVFFTSDNGFFHGEHRIPMEKYRPYEQDIRVPLLVRGPSPVIEADSKTEKLALNTDYLPTFAQLANTSKPSYVDGRSLTGVLDGSATNWRHAILIEGPQYKAVPPYRAIRTLDANTQRKYVEYGGTSQREMYYLGADPHELANKKVPSAGLAARLDALRVCKGDSCRTAENAH